MFILVYLWCIITLIKLFLIFLFIRLFGSFIACFNVFFACLEVTQYTIYFSIVGDAYLQSIPHVYTMVFVNFFALSYKYLSHILGFLFTHIGVGTLEVLSYPDFTNIFVDSTTSIFQEHVHITLELCNLVPYF